MDAIAETAQPQVQHPNRAALYALPDILARGCFSKSHAYNLMARGQFPQPTLRCGPRFTRWSAKEVDRWFADPAAFIAAHSAVQT